MISFLFSAALAIALLILSIRYYKLKRQMRSMVKQLQESLPCQCSVSIELFDRDLEALALVVNKRMDEHRQILLSLEENQQYLKSSIADITHDIRTPLTSIIGYIQLLSKSNLDEDQRQFINIALERAQYLSTLLESVYELSAIRADTSEVILERVDLAGIVSEIILDNANEFKRRSIAPVFKSFGKPVFILANAEKLQRIIQNLVSNCLRYSCGDVIFKITENDMIELIIENPTVDAAAIETQRIFDRFYKADTARSGQGTGLGLAITQLLTKSMGGMISAHIVNDLFVVKLCFSGVG